MALYEICQVLNEIHVPFTLQDMVDVGIAMDPPVDLHVKKIGAGVASLAHIGSLRELGYAQNSRAKRYEKNPEISDYVEAEKAGKFKGLYSQYRGQSTPRASTMTAAQEVESEPEVVIEQHDPEEILKALPVDTIMSVVASHFEKLRGEGGPLREQYERALSELRFERGQHDSDERASQTKINGLNNELRTVREQLLEARNQVSFMNARAQREPEPKILLQRDTGGQLQAREHGGSGGGKVGFVTGGSHAMHNKPRTGHAPRVVVEYVTKKKL